MFFILFERKKTNFSVVCCNVWDELEQVSARLADVACNVSTTYCFVAIFSEPIHTNSNLSPSNKPKSLNFNEGITSKAINERDINGEIKVLPIYSLTILSISM